MTRSGRIQEPSYRATPTLEMPTSVDENLLIKQSNRTKDEVKTWKLITSSVEHRNSLINALAKLNITPKTIPNDLVGLLANLEEGIIFTDKYLALKGAGHHKELYLTVEYKDKTITKNLVDNVSSINVFPLRTAEYLWFTQTDFTNSSLGILAYDNSCREAMGP